MGRTRNGTLGLSAHLERMIREEARDCGATRDQLDAALRAAATLAREFARQTGRRNWDSHVDAGHVLEAARRHLPVR